jgi:molybdate transport system ATP-binding protein
MSLAVGLTHAAPLLDFRAEIPAGQITALVGPSGSGKTSILRAIAGLLRTRHAEISLDGEVWDDAPARARFRATALRAVSPPEAQGNVAAALLHLPAAERVRRAAECLALAQVDGLDARFPRELSGGQKQRVALARAIARSPNLLLLDEAAQLASHLVLIQHGRVVQSGPTADVLTRPASIEAARLLDIPNLFAAQAEGDMLRWGPLPCACRRRSMAQYILPCCPKTSC